MSFDAVVVGAGPAGATCALDLARGGLRVALIDRATPPRYKTCGGGIVARAVGALDVDVSGAIERSLRRLELRLDAKSRAFGIERASAPVVMAMRAPFDALLGDAAREAGAEVLAPCAFRGLRRVGSRFEVQTERGALEAAFVVGADGAGSRVARAAGWTGTLHTVPALESEIRVDEKTFARFSGAARFDFGVVPDGYGWVFPKKRHLSVGCLSTRLAGDKRRSGAAGLPRYLERYLGTLGLAEPVGREDHGFVIPARPRSGRLARRGVFLVGDAAGLADPLTCEGISNAIQSGRLAARAMIESRGDGERSARRYDDLLSTTLLPELRWARRLATPLYRYPGLRGFVFRRMGPQLCEAITDVFMGQRTYRDLLLRPVTYWRFMGALARPSVAG